RGTRMNELPRLWLVRHGETEWSRSGQYTGLTDLPLTRHGEEQARRAGRTLEAIRAAGTEFQLAMTSPLQRARHTAELAGFPGAESVEWAHEWDYGVPGGETIDQVGDRAGRIVQRVRTDLADGGNAVLFSHGHFSRILAAVWLGLDPRQGRHFVLGTAQVCRLGWDKRTPAVEAWGL